MRVLDMAAGHGLLGIEIAKQNPQAGVHAALRPGGRAATLEFVPNEDRISPPMPRPSA